MRTVIVFILALLVLLPSSSSVASQKTIKVGMLQLEPLNYTDKFGHAQGLYPDLLREMVRHDELQLVFVPGTWKECLERLENGSIDLLTTVARSPQRERKFDFNAESVVDNWSQVFSLPGKKIETFQDLHGKRVAIGIKDINGRNFIKTVENMQVEPQIIRFENYEDIFKAVQNGEADALVSSQHFGFRRAGAYGLVATSIQFSPIPIYFAVMKGKQAEILSHIDQHLREWKKEQDSFYYQRVAYWISGKNVQPDNTIWWMTIVAFSSSIALFLLIRNRTMSKVERRRTKEEKLRDLILGETALEGFAKVGMDGSFLQVNDKYLNMMGYSRDEMLNLKISDVEVFENAQEIATHIQKIIERGGDRFETQHKTKTGKLIDLEISTSYFPGTPPVFYTFCRDITSRKKADETLRASEERFSLAMSATTDGLWDWNVQNREVYYSPAWYKILGLKQEENGFSIWENRIHPEDRDIALSSLQEHLDGNSDAWRCEHRLLDSSGNYRQVIGRGKVVARDNNDQPLRMVGTMTDVSALHQAEAERDRLFNYSLDMLCIAGADGFFQQLNPAWEKTLGWSIEELKKKPWLELVHPEDVNNTMEARDELVEGKPALGFENRYQCKDGSFRWLSWNTIPLPEEGLLFGIARDVTDAKQAAEHRQQLEEQLRWSQKMEAIGTLAGGIAHDFNNILTPVIAHATMAKRKLGEDNPLKNHVLQIEKSALRAAELVKQILSISRKGKDIDTTTDLRLMLKDIANFIRASIPSTISIDLELAEENLLVAADSNQVHQIILNLCTNAKDAMDESGGTLRLSAKPFEKEDGSKFIRLSVSDTGEGIPEDAHDRIFDPYFTTKKFGKGSGLGLAVVHGVVSSLNGEISVTSQPGEGTKIEVLFPVAEKKNNHQTAKPEQICYGDGEHILVIDDEVQVTETVTMLLEELKYRVTAFNSSEEAYEVFKADPEKFDVVLTDQTMPQLTGLNLARKLSGMRPEIPIILGTGYLEGINLERALQHGVTKLLYKPYELEVLSAALVQVFKAAK